jgi:hypothetical protein
MRLLINYILIVNILMTFRDNLIREINLVNNVDFGNIILIINCRLIGL